MRHRAMRTDEYHTSAPPKDGSEIVVPCLLEVAVFWDDAIRRWVLVRPVHLDTLNSAIVKWKRPR